MSASRALSRCVVTLETSGSATEELFAHRIDAAAERIEGLFDALEQGDRRFVRPREAGFVQPRMSAHRNGDETCRLELLCTPPLSAAELEALTTRVAAMVSELPDVTPRGLPAVERVEDDADTDPGEPPKQRPGDVPTRQHVPASSRAETRPEGVPPRPVPDVHAVDEVTDPQSKDEVPTRPEGVIAIRRTGVRDDEA